MEVPSGRPARAPARPPRRGAGAPCAALLLAAALLAGCSQIPPQPAAAAPAAKREPAPPPAPAHPFEQALRQAVQDVFAQAGLAAGPPQPLVIVPFADGRTGVQSAATAAMQEQIEQLLRDTLPRHGLQPFRPPALADRPMALMGTFTPAHRSAAGTGPRDAYRICLLLVDLQTGRLAGKGAALSRAEGVDPTPTAFFRDNPLWVSGLPAQEVHGLCEYTAVGAPLPPHHRDRLATAAAIDEAMAAYDAGRYREALALYNAALRKAEDDQSWIYAGLHLVQMKLGQRTAALRAFARVVDHGLDHDGVAVRFGFRPAAAGFALDGTPYDAWLREIARVAATDKSLACLEVSGHGSAGADDGAQSLQQAQFVRQRLLALRKDLARRVVAVGQGARQPLVGTGRGDASDALDRRIGFRRLPRCDG